MPQPAPTDGDDQRDDPFVTHRRLLFTVAYQVLGSAADAEDVLQEAWLRWAAVDRSQVHDPRAYLVRVVGRQALNHVRTVARRREDYVGQWLPEPLLTTPDVAQDVELADSVSLAMLTVLQTLGPTERVVFVLREVFDVPYDEIAASVGRTPDAVRQVAHRARAHVAARRPRVPVAREEHRRVVDRLVEALSTGDVSALTDVLAPDVVAVADGGGKVPGALPRPVVGAQRLARYLVSGLARAGAGVRVSALWVNGEPAVALEVDGVLLGVSTFTVSDGRVTHVLSIANPDKLQRLAVPAELGR